MCQNRFRPRSTKSFVRELLRLELSPPQDGDATDDCGAELGWDLRTDVRGRLARDDGWDDQLLRQRGRAAAHHLSGGDARVRQGDLPGSLGGGSVPGEGEVSSSPLHRDRRRRQGELGIPGTTYRHPGRGLLACGGVSGQGGVGAVPGPTRGATVVDGRELSHAETRTRGRGHGPEAVEVAGESAVVGEGRRGRATSHHLLHEPIGSGTDGLRGGSVPKKWWLVTAHNSLVFQAR